MANKKDDFDVPFELEDPSETRTEPDTYNKIIYQQIARISRLISETSRDVRGKADSFFVLYFSMVNLDSLLRPMVRGNFLKKGQKASTRKPEIYKERPDPYKIIYLNTDERINFLVKISRWHRNQIGVFSKAPNVLPPRSVKLNMGTSEITPLD